MTWMILSDGYECSLQFPTFGDITIERFAHSLAQINRFTGHAARPYSVAEHSLLVLDIAERLMKLDVHGQLAALMHDAHEAITNDISTPAKQEIGAGWRAFEAKHAHMVAGHFRLHTAVVQNHLHIHAADRLALATERHWLLPHVQPNGQPSTPWPILAGVDPLLDIDLMDPARERMTWREWRDAFLERFFELQFARAEAAALRLETTP